MPDILLFDDRVITLAEYRLELHERWANVPECISSLRDVLTDWILFQHFQRAWICSTNNKLAWDVILIGIIIIILLVHCLIAIFSSLNRKTERYNRGRIYDRKMFFTFMTLHTDIQFYVTATYIFFIIPLRNYKIACEFYMISKSYRITSDYFEKCK